jgi:hypothetical protein
MEAMLSAAGVVRGSEGTRWSLRGSGTGQAVLRGVSRTAAHGTALLQCVLDAGEGRIALHDGSLTLTVPRGDRLRARFEGTASPPDPQGFIDLRGELTITGGTGDFLGAAGGGPVTGTVDTSRWTFFITGQLRAELVPAGQHGRRRCQE